MDGFSSKSPTNIIKLDSLLFFHPYFAQESILTRGSSMVSRSGLNGPPLISHFPVKAECIIVRGCETMPSCPKK